MSYKLYEAMNSMSKDELAEELEKLKKLKNAVENKLKEHDGPKLIYPSGKCWIVEAFNASSSRESFPIKQNLLSNGCYRTTQENALNAAIKRTSANIIEAYAEQIDPEWKENWSEWNNKAKYYIVYDNDAKEFEYESILYSEAIGVPYMSENTAVKIVEMLNNGIIKLPIMTKK